MSSTPPASPFTHPILLAANEPIVIGSADDYLGASHALEAAAENIRIARLAGMLHQLADIISSTPLISGAGLSCSRAFGNEALSGAIQLIARAPNGFEMPADNACLAFLDNGTSYTNHGVKAEHYPVARASFPKDIRPEIGRLQEAGGAIWASARKLLTPQEIMAALPLPSDNLLIARGPRAADMARQWGFEWLAARIELMQLDRVDAGPASPAGSNPQRRL